MTCIEYLSGATKNVNAVLEVKKAALKSFGGGHCSYHSSYRPELEVTNELYAEFINRFQQLIVVLR